MLNVVILPEIFDPIFWPNTYQPCTSTKQVYLYKTMFKNCSITFDPNKISDELIITDIESKKQTVENVAKNTKYFKNYFVYACSIQIKALIINNLKNTFRESYREIYIPDIYTSNPTVFNFFCQGLFEIKITRHIQFTPYVLYKEIFEPQLHNLKIAYDIDNIKEGYSYFINKFKYAY